MSVELFQTLYRLTEKGFYYTVAQYPNYAASCSERAQKISSEIVGRDFSLQPAQQTDKYEY
jgi:hypothetical protein